MPNNCYDLIVIGAGPAGTCGANAAGIFGHRVALVEKEVDIGVDLSLRRETTIADFMRHKDTEGRVALWRRRRWASLSALSGRSRSASPSLRVAANGERTGIGARRRGGWESGWGSGRRRRIERHLLGWDRLGWLAPGRWRSACIGRAWWGGRWLPERE